MSDATTPPSGAKAGPTIGTTAEEVQGTFPSDAALQEAIALLTQSGFDRADLSLPDATPAAQTATPEQGAENPNTDTDDRQVRTLQASMAGTVGAIAAAGVVIATGGAAIPAVAAAAAAGLGAGGLAHAAGSASKTAQHSSREDSARAGTLVLSVRATTSERRSQAEALLRQAGATQIGQVERATAAIDLPS